MRRPVYREFFTEEEWTQLQEVWRKKLRMCDMNGRQSYLYHKYRKLTNQARAQGLCVPRKDRRANPEYRKWLKEEGIPKGTDTRADYMRFRRAMNWKGKTFVDRRVNQAYREWLEQQGINPVEATSADYQRFRYQQKKEEANECATADRVAGPDTGSDRDLQG